jgi:hypothetical protein
MAPQFENEENYRFTRVFQQLFSGSAYCRGKVSPDGPPRAPFDLWQAFEIPARNSATFRALIESEDHHRLAKIWIRGSVQTSLKWLDILALDFSTGLF